MSRDVEQGGSLVSQGTVLEGGLGQEWLGGCASHGTSLKSSFCASKDMTERMTRTLAAWEKNVCKACMWWISKIQKPQRTPMTQQRKYTAAQFKSE